MDAVQRANSGHPGAPMGMADIAEVLWNDFLRHNPANPRWPDRDRFVLSNGHGSMLLYSVLHLSGYALGLDELERFRQLHSLTPGHPEYGETPGVETTTGPLGQGLANAVGMAIAERLLSAHFNRPGFEIVDHRTYVAIGDGCLMEGISHEACSLAGTLGLGKLIALYDDNGVSIDGSVEGWFTDDTPARFEAYGWHVVRGVDGHAPEAIAAALRAALEATDRPSLLCCRTRIGWGAPNKEGSAECHGSPLGEEEVALTRARIGWQHPPFAIPPHVYAAWDARARGTEEERRWRELFERYRARHPALAAEFERRTDGRLPENWETDSLGFIRSVNRSPGKPATRVASQKTLEAYGALLPELIGGSADLTGSNGTRWSGSQTISRAHPGGNYLHYGVREFAMSAIMNGLALHGGVIPYGGTFLVFSDYARNAVRLAALMGIGSIFVYTHDSIGLGEDGPTHQAIEHLASLRLVPGLTVWRPCDAVETAVAWRDAIGRRDGPSALVLTRQGVASPGPRTEAQLDGIARGGYVLLDPAGTPDALIIATGSEIPIAMTAAQTLNAQGTSTRVVSMPCTELFDAQDRAYRDHVLPPALRRRVAVEAARGDLWHKYVGLDGRTVGMNGFGASAPGEVLYAHFGITAEAVVAAVAATA
jgi:transketolase